MRLVELLKFLVGKALVGERISIEIAYLHFVHDYGVGELAKMFSLDKKQVRGLINRIYERVPSRKRNLVKKLLELAYPSLISIEPLMIMYDHDRAVCMLCGSVLRAYYINHFLKHHPDIVDQYTRRIIDVVLRKLTNRARAVYVYPCIRRSG